MDMATIIGCALDSTQTLQLSQQLKSIEEKDEAAEGENRRKGGEVGEK